MERLLLQQLQLCLTAQTLNQIAARPHLSSTWCMLQVFAIRPLSQGSARAVEISSIAVVNKSRSPWYTAALFAQSVHL